MLSDLEKMDKMLGSNHFERENSEVLLEGLKVPVMMREWIIIPNITLTQERKKSGCLPEMTTIQERLILVVK